MLSRIVLVLAVAAVLQMLLTVHITLPLLTVAGLVAWAVFASVVAVVLLLRRPAPPVPLRAEVVDHAA